ncbi:MAG: porphobilinogen synthase [Verrucomicrobiia bacterium]|jgi:porphobilinogen synthase
MNFNIFSSYPVYRPRRLRQNEELRELVRETRLQVSQLVMPYFVRPGKNLRLPIDAMPGNFQLSTDELVKEVLKAVESGIKAILLFGIPETKDELASGAYAEDGIIQQAVSILKKEYPHLIIITDVCLCEYMSHGHCGYVKKTGDKYEIDNDSTLNLLAKTALSYARAGADMVAPSDMMDGRVRVIRQILDDNGFENIPIMSYAAKFASAFYGPFRQAAESAPQFGDRRSYQMDSANALEALREVALDIQEGADIVMVKPALSCLDIIYRVKTTFGYPTAAYAVSAEYSMIKAAAQKGWIDEKAVTLESLLAIKRAGADIIITYSAVEAAKWLASK